MTVRRAAVLGSPIAHSLSPVLHGAAYRALGLNQWAYDAHEVEESQLPGFVAGLGPEWVGLSLTMPLKEVAFTVAAEVSDLAAEVGAINTLVRRADGGWRGDNTDVFGVSEALREAGCASAARAVVLGSGATARAVLAALVTLGCTKVTLAVRAAVRQETVDQGARAGLEVDVVALAQLAKLLADAPVVVSTLPANALTANALTANALTTHALTTETEAGRVPTQVSSPADRFLLDVVYSGWPTPMARIFQEAGGTVLSGLDMLIHQAAEQVHLMTGLRPPVDQMRAAGLAAMGSR